MRCFYAKNQTGGKQNERIINNLWLFLLAFAGGLSTISAGIAVIVNIIHKAKSPNQKQNERIAAHV
ncbi:MAG: hypothetical protein J6O50_06950 [Ruminiclostridium sp.]|nr:hypothetical protein [Ruminiclostridium sp.]